MNKLFRDIDQEEIMKRAPYKLRHISTVRLAGGPGEVGEAGEAVPGGTGEAGYNQPESLKLKQNRIMANPIIAFLINEGTSAKFQDPMNMLKRRTQFVIQLKHSPDLFEKFRLLNPLPSDMFTVRR